MVGEGETHQEGREQQVAVGAGVSPDEQDQDDERHEEGFEGVDLGDHGLAPEGVGEPEGQRPGRRGHGPSTQP